MENELYEPSKLYLRDQYLNKDIGHIFCRDIYEYDMKRAGPSLIREFNLMPINTLKKFEKSSKSKEEVDIKIGQYQRDNSVFKDRLKNAFIEARKRFFEENKIEDFDILSIKKDAIFILRKCDVSKVGDYIDFRLKHHYTSYIYLSKLKYEIYYTNDDFSIKGMSDKNMYIHKDHMIKLIKEFLYQREIGEDIDAIKFLRVYIDLYKQRKLDCQYYRSFDGLSSYKTYDGIEYRDIGKDLLPDIDIQPNFEKVLISLMMSVI